MQKDDATWLNISYAVFALLVGYVAFKLVETVGIEFGWEERYASWFPNVRIAIAAVVGVVSAVLLRRSQERHQYYLSAIAELRKVTWPSLDDTRRMTIIVCVFVGIFALILAGFDLVWARALDIILPA